MGKWILKILRLSKKQLRCTRILTYSYDRDLLKELNTMICLNLEELFFGFQKSLLKSFIELKYQTLIMVIEFIP